MFSVGTLTALGFQQSAISKKEEQITIGLCFIMVSPAMGIGKEADS
jgi:hypothetical protein